jgi:hypothetical protein
MNQCEGQINLFDMFNEQNASNTVKLYLEEAVLYGTGFTGGKERIAKLYKENLTQKERMYRIKKEYGVGGAGWPLYGNGLHGYETCAEEFKIKWRDEIGKHEKSESWESVEKVIHSLINQKQYC